MKTLSVGIIFVLIATVVLLNACGGEEIDKNISTSNNLQNANPASLVKDDVEELGKTIKLPFEPEEVVWQDDNLKELLRF
jgi:ABC-type enterochelin transport system substrate-binding protein